MSRLPEEATQALHVEHGKPAVGPLPLLDEGRALEVARHPVDEGQEDEKGGRHQQRVARLLEDESGPSELNLAGGQTRGIWLLEWLGRRAYRLAARAAGPAASELEGLVREFGNARRVLNLLTGRHLFPSRERWFPTARD